MTTFPGIPSIPVLRWRTVGPTLTRLTADINARESFLIEYRPEEPVGYQWQLRIKKRDVAERGVLLHSHTTSAEAKAAAARHVGDE